MKKLVILVLFISVLFSKEYTIGFSQATLANDWLQAQLKEMKQSVKNYPELKLVVKNADGKIAKQVRDIEELIQMGVDFIIAMPLDTKITAMALKKAMDKGIKVVLISRTVSGEDYTAFVGPNNYHIGNEAAELLAQKIDFQGTILMLKGIKGASSTQARTKGFLDVIKKYPRIQVIQRRGNYLRNDAMKMMEDIYRRNINFDAIYSQSDSMLIGVRKVMHKNKINPNNIPAVGIDYIKKAQESIINGEQFASFVYPTSAKEGIDTIVKIINNQEVPKITYIKSKLVTIENAKKIEPIF